MIEISIDQPELIMTCLEEGMVGVLPTDTVYGLACLPTRPDAIEHIYHIKGRPKTFNLPIFADSLHTIRNLGLIVDDKVKRIAHSPLVPGAITMVLEVNKKRCPDWLAGREEAAVRIPANDFILDLVRQLGPLLCTSANKHGSKVDNRSYEAVIDDLPQFNGFTVSAGDLERINSTIVNCRTEKVTLEREGAVPFSEVEKLFQ